MLRACLVVALPGVTAGLPVASTVRAADTPLTLAPVSTDHRAAIEQALAEFDEAQGLLATAPDRARELFRSSARRFQSVVDAGIANGRLEYNLGNALLQAGDLGRAILHYRRAERLLPRDAYLADNLAAARSKCLTNIRPAAASTILRNVFFWHFETSTRERTFLALVGYCVFWVLLGLRMRRRRGFIWSSGVALISTTALALSVIRDDQQDRRRPAGVVLAFDVPAYKGPGAGYQRQFEQPLQPGVEFIRMEDRGAWWRVQLADGNAGWISSATAELVVAGDAN